MSLQPRHCAVVVVQEGGARAKDCLVFRGKNGGRPDALMRSDSLVDHIVSAFGSEEINLMRSAQIETRGDAFDPALRSAIRKGNLDLHLALLQTTSSLPRPPRSPDKLLRLQHCYQIPSNTWAGMACQTAGDVWRSGYERHLSRDGYWHIMNPDTPSPERGVLADWYRNVVPRAHCDLVQSTLDQAEFGLRGRDARTLRIATCAYPSTDVLFDRLASAAGFSWDRIPKRSSLWQWRVNTGRAVANGGYLQSTIPVPQSA